MAITLNWSNRGQAVTAVKIYRSPRRLGTFVLINTVDSAAETYTDDTALPNTLYFYKVALVIGGDEVPGSIIPMMDVGDTGPGPKTLLAGTWELGYFGELTPADFITGSALATNYTPYMFSASSSPITNWRKYACEGRIIYIPNGPVWASNNTSVQTLLNNIYAAGMFYSHGTTAKHSAITYPTATLQNRSIAKDGYEFRIRLPRGNYDADPLTDLWVNNPLQTSGSEVALIQTPTGAISNVTAISNGQAFPRVGPRGAILNLSGPVCLTQTFATTTRIGYFDTSSTAPSLSSMSIAGSAMLYLLPVLELVLG